MYVSGVQDLQTLVNAFVTEMKIIILDFKGLFKVTQGRTKFLSTSEDASEIVVSYCSVLISFFRQSLCLSQEFKGNIEVF